MNTVNILHILIVLIIVMSIYHFIEYRKRESHNDEMKSILSINNSTNGKLSDKITQNYNEIRNRSDVSNKQSEFNSNKIAYYNDLNACNNKLLMCMRNKVN